MEKKITSEHNLAFWFHLFITSLAWVGPFLFSWQYMCIAYGIILLQFAFFDRCLLNAQHGLENDNDSTFYTYLLESNGFKVNRKLIRVIVRRYLYVVFGAFAWFWQVYLGHKALLF